MNVEENSKVSADTAGPALTAAATDAAAETTPEAAAVDISALIAELDAATARLPRQAILKLREHRAAAVPALIAALESATARVAAGENVEGNAHFFALFLLTEFNATKAVPAILAAISLPGDGPFDLFGDAVTGNLPSILAQLAPDPDLLDRLIADPELNEYVRWEAAMTFHHLIRDGRVTREEAEDRLARHIERFAERWDREFPALVDTDAASTENDDGDEPLDAGSEPADAEVLSMLIGVLASLGPTRHVELIRAQYAAGRVDEWMLRRRHLEEAAADPEATWAQTLSRLEPTGIPDTIAELETWAAFNETPRKPAWSGGTPAPARPVLDSVSLPEIPAGETIIRAQRKVGRNEPCPCGSGKKHKKCCGAGR